MKRETKKSSTCRVHYGETVRRRRKKKKKKEEEEEDRNDDVEAWADAAAAWRGQT